MTELRVSFNKDGTISVRVGRAVEHIDIADKTKAEVFEYLKWAAISKGVSLSDVALTEILHNAS